MPSLRNHSARAIARAVVGSAVLALAACGTAPLPETQEGRLFGEVYREVAHYHMQKTDAEHLSLSALQTMTRVDPALSVEAANSELVLHRGDEAARFRMPLADDSAAWGMLTAQVATAARNWSPSFADLAPDLADERLIDGALAPLDRFSRYVRPEVARERRAQRDGFVGLGVALDIAPDDVRVATVLPDTPAAAAGLRVSDRIVAVDGTALDELTPDQIRERLRGPKDTTVKLEVARADGTFSFVIRRGIIVAESATLRIRDGVAWLSVRGFNQRTARSAAAALAEAHEQQGGALRGIVLDLRDNPGGLLDQAIELADLFLKGVPVSTTIGRAPDSHQSFAAPRDNHPETLPMVVLVNGGSASSSEIVAAALQDAGRAVVVGSASYGKGTVQTVFRTGNGGELTVTWAQLMAPRGYPLDHHGVVPTLCTAEDAETTAILAGGPSPLARPREALDDADWSALRARCPPLRGKREVDQVLAARVLAEPLLYRSLLIGQAEDKPGGLPHKIEAQARP